MKHQYLLYGLWKLLFISQFFCLCYAQEPILKLDAEKKLYGYCSSKDSNHFLIAAAYQRASNFYEKTARVAISHHYYLVNKKGKLLHKNPYDYIGWSDDTDFKITPFVSHPARKHEKRIAFKKGSYWGLLNQRGKEILKSKYASIEKYKYGLARVSVYDSLTKKRKYGAIDFGGREIIAATYEILEWEDSLVIRFSKDCSCDTPTKQGLLNFHGEILVDAHYPSIKYLREKRYGLQDSLGFWGVMNEKGQRITPFIYEQLEHFIQGKCIATLEGRKGIIDTEGRTIAAFTHQEIFFKDGRWWLLCLPQHEIIDEEGKPLLTFYADTLYAVLPEWYVFTLNEKKGFVYLSEDKKVRIQYTYVDEVIAVDSSGYIARKGSEVGKISWEGTIQIPFRYKSLKKETSHLYRATLKSGEEILLNSNGENVTSKDDTLGDKFFAGMIKIKRQNLFGFIDSLGNLQIPPQFIQADDFGKRYAVVQTVEGYFGVIDQQGNWVISPVVDSLKKIQDDLFFFKDNGWWGTLNEEGIEQFKDNATDYQFIGEHIVVIDKQRKKKGVLNKHGKLLLSPQAQEIVLENEDYLRVNIENNWYWIDTHADSIAGSFKNLFNCTHQPINGTVPFLHGELWGLANSWGQWIISPRYDSIKPLSEGMVPFKIGDKWGYLDLLERIVIQPRYTFAGNFQHRRAVVSLHQKFALINENGHWILSPNYEAIKATPYGNWLVQQKGLWGIYTNDGMQGIYPKYDAIEDVGNGYVITCKNGRYGIDKISGLTIVFPKYQRITAIKEKKLFILTTPSQQLLLK